MRLSLLAELIEASLERMLSRRAHRNIAEMARECPARRCRLCGLQPAELAFREGRFHESETLAALAARGANGECARDSQARAHIVAGRAAHAASREERRSARYQRARQITASPGASPHRDASGNSRPQSSLNSRTKRLSCFALSARAGALEPDERVIYRGRKINLESQFGLTSRRSRAVGRCGSYLHRVADPVHGTSFRNVFGYALAAVGHYDEALEVTQEQLDEADRSSASLSWCRTH